MNSVDLIKILKSEGWTIARVKGSHHQLVKNGRTVTVPHPKKDLGVGLVKAIFRQAGIER